MAIGLVVAVAVAVAAPRRERVARGTPESDAPPQAAVTGLASTSEPSPELAPSTAVREEVATSAGTVAPDPWRGELAALIGRVVESDGAPVAGIHVALLELDASYFFDGGWIAAEEPRLELEETRTDREGRFALGGARGAALHGLGIDLAGPRATVRLVDHGLTDGARTDVGDIVLAAFGVVTGRVLDEHGVPVAGARVRFAPLPEEVLAASPQDFRSESLLALGPVVMGEGCTLVVEPPAWIRKAVDRLPIPTTQTRTDGTFRLEGVALAEVIGGVDKRGYAGAGVAAFDVSGGSHDVGDVVLAHGRTIHGTVEDDSGDAVAGAEVYAGAEIAPGVAAILQPCGTSDAEGRFELAGVAAAGQIVAAARRAGHEAWSTTVASRPDGVLIELQATVRLTVNVRDEQGQPLSGARVRVAPAPAGWQREADSREPRELELARAVLPLPASSAQAFPELEPGRYVDASLGRGGYVVFANAAGRAPGYAGAECSGEATEVTVVCSAGRRVDLRVIDARTKAPVSGARASALRVDRAWLQKLAVARTDASGSALIGPLPELPEARERTGLLARGTLLLVEHPRYGNHAAPLRPDVSSLVVELEAGGELVGRVHWGGAVPACTYMVSATMRGVGDGLEEFFHLPRLSVTDASGAFRLGNLASGKYGIDLQERALHLDPVVATKKSFPVLHHAEVEIRDGETSELVIDLTPTGRGTVARLVGRVRVDGRDIEGAVVQVSGVESVSVRTDASGRFETPAFTFRDAVSVRIDGEIRLGEGPAQRTRLYSELIRLQPDEVHELDLELAPQTLRVRVLDADSGQPIPGASVWAPSSSLPDVFASGLSLTDAAGEAEVRVLKPGAYMLSASAPSHGQASIPVDVLPGGSSGAAILRLHPAVPCAGRIQIDPDELDTQHVYLSVLGAAGSSTGGRVQTPGLAFEVDGLSAGEYRAVIRAGGRAGEEVPFTLGPEGSRELILRFTPSSRPNR